MRDTRGQRRHMPGLDRSAGRQLPALLLCMLPVSALVGVPDVVRGREAPQAEATLSLDQAIAMAEKRHNARVVRASTSESDGQRVYVLRMLSDEGRVWTVRIDAATGAEK